MSPRACLSVVVLYASSFQSIRKQLYTDDISASFLVVCVKEILLEHPCDSTFICKCNSVRFKYSGNEQYVVA